MGRQFNCRQNRLSSQRFGAPTKIFKKTFAILIFSSRPEFTLSEVEGPLRGKDSFLQ